MGRKNILEPHLVMNAADLSGNVTSEETWVKNLDRYMYEVEWDGATVDGALTVEIQSKEDGPWEVLPIGVMSVNTDTGSHKISITEITWNRTRLVYTANTGTGAISASINAGTIGA